MTLAVLMIFGGWISIRDARDFIIPDEAIIAGLAFLTAGCLIGILEPAGALTGMALAGGQTAVVYGFGRCRRRKEKHGGCDRFGLGDVKYSLLLGGFLEPAGWLTALGAAVLCAFADFAVRTAGDHREIGNPLPFAPYLTIGALSVAIFRIGAIQ